MGQKFIGSVDTEVANIGAIGNGEGAWVQVPAEQHVLEVVCSNATSGPHTIIIESELGVIHTFTIPDGTGTQTRRVSLGGFPGGRRIRARWTVAAGLLAAVVTARETRDGIA